MKSKLKAILPLIGLFLLRFQTFSQAPDFTGTWVLNFEKSKLEHKPDGLTSSIFIIKQDGDQFSLARYHIFGKKRKKISFKMIPDGKKRRVKILFKGKLEKKEDGLQATLWRKHFLNIVNYKFGNSHNEFIADEVFTGNPNNHHNIWVFDRDNPNNNKSSQPSN